MAERAIHVAVKCELARRGKSFGWLAERMGLSKPTVSNQLRADKGPTDDFLKRAAKALGIGYKRLLQMAEEEYSKAQAKGLAMQPPMVNGPHRPAAQ